MCTSTKCHFDKVTFRRTRSLDEVSFDEVSHFGTDRQTYRQVCDKNNVSPPQGHKKCLVRTLSSTVNICDRTIGTWLHCFVNKNNCTCVKSFLKKVLINPDSIIKYWRHLTPMFSNNGSSWPPKLQLNSNWNKNQKWLVSYSKLKQEPQGPSTSIDWSEKPFSILYVYIEDSIN